MGPRLRGRHLPSLGTEECKSCGESMGQSSSITAECLRCAAKSLEHAHRIYLGQLSTHRTAQVTMWLLGMLVPEVKVLHIDVHTSRGGKSRGCAWVYLESTKDVLRVLSFHHRVLVDTATGFASDGFQVCGPQSSAIEQLTMYSTNQEHGSQRCPKPLIAEHRPPAHVQPSPIMKMLVQSRGGEPSYPTPIDTSLLDSITLSSYRSDVDTDAHSVSLDSWRMPDDASSGSMTSYPDNVAKPPPVVSTKSTGTQTFVPAKTFNEGLWQEHPQPTLSASADTSSKKSQTSVYIRNPYGFSAVVHVPSV